MHDVERMWTGMNSLRSSFCAAVFALLMLTQAACSKPATGPTTRAAIETGIKQGTLPWSQATAAPYRKDLIKFAGAPVNRQHLTYDPENRKLTGTAEILFTNGTGHELPTLYMRTFAKLWGDGSGEDFTMTHLKVDGKANSFTVGTTLITIPLAKPLAPGQSTLLTYAASVTLPKLSLNQRPGSSLTLTTNVGFYGAGHDFTGVGGFPTLLPRGDEGKEFDTPPDDRDMDNGEYTLDEFWLTVPQQWSVLSFGTVLDETPAKDGKKTVHTAGIGGGGHTNLLITATAVKQTQKVGDVEVNTFVPPFYAEYAEPVMKHTTDALRAYQQAYGPMALPKLDVVTMPLTAAGGAYMHGILTISYTYMTDRKASAPDGVPPALRPLFETDMPLALRRVVFHEVAHAWWGGLVTPDSRSLPWFHEAMANAASYYAFDQTDGPAVGDYHRTKEAFRYQKQRILGMADAPLNWPMERYQSQEQRITLTYSKGALFYDRLRKLVGDERFNAAMRSYVTAHAYDIVPDPGPVAALMNDPGVEQLYRRWVQEAHGDEDIGPLELHDPSLRKALGLPPE